MSATITNKVGIFIALVVITALQIGLAKWHGLSSQGHIIAALLLAMMETILVGIFFMGLRGETRLIKITALFPFLLFCILVGALGLDVLVFLKHGH
jgi:caa(3)-type oxidase subunit IV